MNNRSSVAAFAILIAGAALALGWRSGLVNEETIGSLVGRISSMASIVHVSVCMTFLIGALVYAHVHNAAVLKWAVLAAVVALAANLLAHYFPYPTYRLPTIWEKFLLLITTYMLRQSTYVSLFVLLGVRFQGRLERVRIISLVCMGLLLLTEAALIFGIESRTLSSVARVADTVVLVVLDVLLIVAAWAVAFRQMPPHHPPLDAGKRMAFTCPRCSTAQDMALPQGVCSHCRLKIFVALDEGTCGKCGYALRGLTSDRCPECGAAIAAVTC